MAKPVKRLRFAVLLDSVFSVYQNYLKNGIDRYAFAHDIDTVYFGIGCLRRNIPFEVAQERLLDLIDPDGFDGLLIATSPLMNVNSPDQIRDRLARFADFPKVSIGPAVWDEPTVTVDGIPGLRDLIFHLLRDHGYRELAYVGGPASNPEAQQRLGAYRDCLRECGIVPEPSWEYVGNFQPQSGVAAVSELFDARGLRPRAVVCANDFMAIGVWDALRARGLAVPADVAVCGFDDLQFSTRVALRFSTVRQPFDKQAYLAAERLHALISGGSPESVVIPSEVRLKRSCGCVDFGQSDRSAPLDDLGRFGSAFETFASLIEAKVAAPGPKRSWKPAMDEVSGNWLRLVSGALSEGIRLVDAQRALDSLRPRLRAANPVSRSIADQARALATFDRELMNEYGQSQVIQSYFESYAITTLGWAIDRFFTDLSSDADVAALRQRLAALARECGASALRVYLFRDYRAAGGGLPVVYDIDESAAACADHSIPRVKGGLAVCAIANGIDLLGYVAVSDGIANLPVYQLIQNRFNVGFRDDILRTETRDINRRLEREIAEREEIQRRLSEALSQVERLSIEDELTGLHNRRGFLTLAEQEVKLLRRQNNPFVILFADLDGLKRINDTWGHRDGDLAIVTAAQALRGALRDSDLIARLGGDEFTALVCDADDLSVIGIKERIEREIERLGVELRRPWRLSMSVGFYSCGEGDDRDVAGMLERADAELYRVKQARKTAP